MMNAMDPEEFPSAVRGAAGRFGMDLSRPLAMVSGGPDSVAMLRALVEIGARATVLHVDYGLRDGSREDAAFVEGLCEGLGLGCEVRRVDPGAGRGSGEASGVQEAAREARYALAEGLAATRGLSAILTAHTADDAAETVLMNLARGAGLRGLAGIPPRRGLVGRPLIETRRADVLAYLAHLNQPYRTDPTNLRPKYARNRVRLEVLPVLEELYPGAAANVARAAALLREDLEALEGLAGGMVLMRGGEEAVVPLRGLRETPALARHALRAAFAAVAPEAPPPDRAVVEAVLGLAREDGPMGRLDVGGGVVAAARPGWEVAFYRQAELGEGRGGEAEPREVREGEFRYDGWAVRARRVSGFDPNDAAWPGVAYLDAEGGPYRVRMPREGDEIRPLGLGGTKKVFRAMMDRKVPRDLRRRTPVVVGRGGRVAWVFGGEVAEEFKAHGGRVSWRLEAERAW